MPDFIYKGKNFNGEELTGIFTAENKSFVAKMIKQKGFIPVLIKEKTENPFLRFIRRKIYKIKSKDLAIFCRQFEAMEAAGVPIIESLKLLAKQTHNRILKSAIIKIQIQVNNGLTISEAFKRYPEVFPSVFVCVIESAEIAGKLGYALNRLATYYESVTKRSDKIKSAMTYPIILCIVTIIVIAFLVKNIIPLFDNLFLNTGIYLPYQTRALIFIGNNMTKIIFFLFLFICFINALYIKLSLTPIGAYKIDSVKLNIPYYGNFIKKGLCADFCNILALLFSSGIPLIDAIKTASKALNNQVFKKHLEQTVVKLKNGKNLSDAFSDKLIPELVRKMIKIGEESGDLENMLKKTASFYESEVENIQKNLLTLIEPFMIIIMSIIIGFVVMSIVIPMFDIYNLY
jgi:type IV pilus assembly protein PilC